jgi:O-methyltransferase involved in polyketide biosynthesis
MKRSQDEPAGQLGGVEETLFIPLVARARDSGRRRPLLRDPKAAEMVRSAGVDTARYGRGAGAAFFILRTAILDTWVRAFLASHPAGTVVEIGAGLNTRFERADNGQAHWIDLDLPDVIELRRRFLAGTARRRMVAASVLDQAWLQDVRQSPGPYFFVAEAVLAYLPEDQVTQALARIAAQFPGALVALDTVTRRTLDRQHRVAAKRNLQARLAWACDDPRSLERLGLHVAESATLTRPPAALRAQLPPLYRYLLPLADPLLRRVFAITLFRASSLPPLAQVVPADGEAAPEAGSARMDSSWSMSDAMSQRERVSPSRIHCANAMRNTVAADSAARVAAGSPVPRARSAWAIIVAMTPSLRSSRSWSAGFCSITDCRMREYGRYSSGNSEAAACRAEATTASGDAPAGAASVPSANAWKNCCCPSNSTSRLSLKYRKNVRSVRPTDCAICVAVVCSNP